MKNKSGVYSFIILFISVCALTIGFAAFTRSLDIVNASAEIKPQNSLNVHFPASGNLTPVAGTATSGGDTITLNSGTVIANLKAYFKEPGDFITYNTYFINDSSYDAYLKDIDFSYGSAVCTSFGSNPASSNVLSSVCPNLKLSVSVSDFLSNVSSDVSGLTNKKLPAGSNTAVKIKISYEGNMKSDGDFIANLGDIYFHFASTD